jgi:hypothetical protein
MIRPFTEELARDHASIWILNPTTTRPPTKYTETRLSNLFSSTRVSRSCATLGNPRILSPSGHHGYQDGTSLQTEVGLCFRPSCTMRPKTAVLNTTTIPSQISLTVKGLGLGTIVKRTQILQYRVIGDSKTENKSCITKQAVLTLMELITQDRWQPDTSVEGIATRTRDNLDTQLSEMASYVLSAIGDRKQDSYIALLTTWCNHCLNYITGWGGKATSTPSNWYTCNICDCGDFDICTQCYDSGKRCNERGHELKKAAVASMWFPYDEELIRTLKAHGNK